MLAKQRKVAIFDVDGTIFRSSLFIELTEELINAGIWPACLRRQYEKEFRGWLNRFDTYEKYIDRVVEVFMANIKGIAYKDFSRVIDDMLKVKRHRVYRYTRDLLAKLKKKKYFLLAISQSPKGVLDKFCDKLGFDKVYGRLYELGPTDRFTGQIVDLHLISNKANIVKRAVEKENLTLKDSYGVGDTEGDISMLELVDHPICFNPNATLCRYAKLNHWPIVVERKDVVYELS